MIGSVLTSLFQSLFLTLLIEIFFAWLLGIREQKDFVLVLLVNVLTNPLLVLLLDILYLYFPAQLTWQLIIFLECLVVCAEALLYRNCLSFRRLSPFSLSLLLNGISYLGGLLL